LHRPNDQGDFDCNVQIQRRLADETTAVELVLISKIFLSSPDQDLDWSLILFTPTTSTTSMVETLFTGILSFFISYLIYGFKVLTANDTVLLRLP